MLSDVLGCVNSRQERKLTDGAGNRNGKAKGMSRFRVFLAIHDEHVFLPGGNLVLGRDVFYFRPLCLSEHSETARFVVSVTIVAHTSHYHTECHLLSAVNCFDEDGAGGTGGDARPLVDLTMMSRVEKPSNNRNAANPSYLVVFASRVLRICGLLYDMMMMVVRQLPAYVVSAGGQRPVPRHPVVGASRPIRGRIIYR